MLRLMELDFGIVHRPRKYQEDADKIFREPQKTSKNSENTDVRDRHLAYSIRGQIWKPSVVYILNEDEVRSLRTSKGRPHEQGKDVFCSSMRVLVEEDGTITIMLLYYSAEKNPLVKPKITSPYSYKRTLLYHGDYIKPIGRLEKYSMF